MLRNVENRRDQNLGQPHKFTTFKSGFDFKRKKNINIESDHGDVSAVNTSTGLSTMSQTPTKKKWKSMINKKEEKGMDLFGNDHIDDTYFFRTQSRFDREQTLSPKKD